jgi:hypothetical protein
LKIGHARSVISHSTVKQKHRRTGTALGSEQARTIMFQPQRVDHV